ncbi:VC0807 family protein [Kurthia sp. Dielmo]|uniref:VC0807 family protein n=1 Tax=Kurthia sp. Dielmo TaxID=1033738 RepID=UPI00111D90CE|nr:VC0807 family protein [Kurthia sp. Dielmo]
MKKNSTLWDLVFYVAIPLVIWHMRDKIGLTDYMAMVISAGIGIVYGLYMFSKQKKLNVFGTFILADLIITMLITVFSGSAMNLLWNNVYYTYVLAGVYFVSVLIKKPLMLYMALDLFAIDPERRARILPIFHTKKVKLLFVVFTLSIVVKEILSALLQGYLITQYGVNAYDKGILLKQGMNIAFMVITFILVMLIMKEAGKHMSEEEREKFFGS